MSKSVTPGMRQSKKSRKGFGKGILKRNRKDVEVDLVRQLLTGYRVVKSGCWLWKGRLTVNGYGHFTRYVKGTKYRGRAHIASYQYFKGAVPEGLYVCHSCDVKRCINPEHLWLGTNQQNQLDASKKGVFRRYWTKKRRKEWSARQSGTGNPMYGRRGKAAPAYGRVGSKHPMYGKHHTEQSKQKTSKSLRGRFKGENSPMWGRKASLATRKKMSLSRMGNKNACKK